MNYPAEQTQGHSSPFLKRPGYLQGIIVHLLAFLICFVRHQPGLEEVLIETVTKTAHGDVVCNTHTHTDKDENNVLVF